MSDDQTVDVVATEHGIVPVNDPNADLEGGPAIGEPGSLSGAPTVEAPVVVVPPEPVEGEPAAPDAFAAAPLDDVTDVGMVNPGLGANAPLQPTPAAPAEPVTVVPETNLLGQDMTTTGTANADAPVETSATVNAGWIHNELATLEAALAHGTEYVAGELRKLRQAVARKL